MKRLRCRWLLPIGHAFVDCLLLASLIGLANREFRHQSSAIRLPGVVRAAMLQEGDSVQWDPKFDVSYPPPFLAILSGSLPAGLLSGYVRPHAGLITRKNRWDPVWFLLHETVASMCWVLIGAWTDRGRTRVALVMITYLGGRGLLASLGLHEVGWRLGVLFWLGFALWLAAFGISWGVKVVVRQARRGLA